jgi:hypothetical protein
MKKSILFLVFLFHLCLAFAQAPQSFNYQGVARSASNAVLANKTIKVRLTVRHNWAMGTTLYSETRTVTTNATGLFSIQVGSPGALTSTGNFKAIDWTRDTRWLQTEIDANNNNTFVNVGSVQMMSVPYALAANKTDSLKLPMNHTAGNANTLFSISNTQGNAISGMGFNQGVGVRGTTDNNIGVLGNANGSGVGVYGTSTTGVGGRFINQATNQSSALEAEHKGAGNAISARSASGTAISATATNQGVGLRATTDNNIGILATSNNTGTAIYGTSSKGLSGRFVNPSTNTNATLQSQHQGSGAAIDASSVLGNAVQGTSTNKYGVYGFSANNVGGYFSSGPSGRALETNGAVKFAGAGMNPGAGKVLTSDANGNATWQNSTAVAFRGSRLGGNTITDPVLGTTRFLFQIDNTEKYTANDLEFNLGNAYDKTTFTAPYQGIYHFNTGLMFEEMPWETPGQEVQVRIMRKNASTGGNIELASIIWTDMPEMHNSSLATDVLLSPGDKVWVEFAVYAVDFNINRALFNRSAETNNWFSGHLVTRF